MTALLVALGAGLGATVRYAVSSRLDGTLPRGTLLVNVAGSTLLGVLSAVGLAGQLAALLAAGFCGGLTTFSTFAVQVRDGGAKQGPAYAVLTVVLSLTGCALGFWVVARG